MNEKTKSKLTYIVSMACAVLALIFFILSIFIKTDRNLFLPFGFIFVGISNLITVQTNKKKSKTEENK